MKTMKEWSEAPANFISFISSLAKRLHAKGASFTKQKSSDCRQSFFVWIITCFLIRVAKVTFLILDCISSATFLEMQPCDYYWDFLHFCFAHLGQPWPFNKEAGTTFHLLPQIKHSTVILDLLLMYSPRAFKLGFISVNSFWNCSVVFDTKLFFLFLAPFIAEQCGHPLPESSE